MYSACMHPYYQDYVTSAVVEFCGSYTSIAIVTDIIAVYI